MNILDYRSNTIFRRQLHDVFSLKELKLRFLKCKFILEHNSVLQLAECELSSVTADMLKQNLVSFTALFILQKSICSDGATLNKYNLLL